MIFRLCYIDILYHPYASSSDEFVNDSVVRNASRISYNETIVHSNASICVDEAERDP